MPSKKSDIDSQNILPAVVTTEHPPARNHGAVCTVLRHAIRTGGTPEDVVDLCEMLGLDPAAARTFQGS